MSKCKKCGFETTKLRESGRWDWVFGLGLALTLPIAALTFYDFTCLLFRVLGYQ